MNINCDKCGSSFGLDDKSIKKTGSKVRCSKCKNIFLVYPQEKKEEPAKVKKEVSKKIEKPKPESKVARVPIKKQDIDDHELELDSDLDENLDLELDLSMMPDEDDEDFEVKKPKSKKEAPPKKEIKPQKVDKEDNEDDLLDFDEIEKILESDEPQGNGDFDELDLDMDADLDSLDLKLDEDVESVSELSMSEVPDLDLEVPDIDDFDIDEPVDSDEKEDVDLEGLDLRLDLDDDEYSPQSAPANDDEDLDDLKLELDLGYESKKSTPPKKQEKKQDKKQEKKQPEPEFEDEDDGEFDLGLDLEMDGGLEETADAHSKEEDGDIEELEFNLDFGEDDEEIPKKSPAKSKKIEEEFEEDEADLSDIEDMILEEKDEKSEKSENEEEFELDLDLEELAHKPKKQAKPDAVVEEELDFSDLEDMLDEETTQDKDETPEDIELEFDIDFEDTSSKKAPVKSNDDDIELEFETEDIEKTEVTRDTKREKIAETVIGQSSDDEEDIYEEDIYEPEVPQTFSKSKPKKSGFLFVIIFILIIGCAAAGIFLFKDKIPYIKDMDIPFLGGSKAVIQTKESSSVVIENVKNEFVQNANAGKLFVVSGTVKNHYPHSRSYIQLMVKLYSTDEKMIDTKDEKMIDSKTVYCGNTLTDDELKTLDIKLIEMRLGKPEGDNNMGLNIKPNESIPFMVVFSPSKELKTFKPEIVNSVEVR
ncbi:MAG: zinc-ribbon domain-containing protein [Desulfobacterales bacterium]|nr:zinc-ribbon domain-containing protein [Desulfobacterales bacterium]